MQHIHVCTSTSTMIQVSPPQLILARKNEHPTDVQHSGWRFLLRNLRWHGRAFFLALRNHGRASENHLVNSDRENTRGIAVFHRISTLHSIGMDRQNNFITTYIVELSKPNRMVLESWKSVQAHYFVPLYREVCFLAAFGMHADNRLPRSSWTSLGNKRSISRQQKSWSTRRSLFGAVELKCKRARACRKPNVNRKKITQWNVAT